MGKWAARLAERTSTPPYVGTDETAKRGVLSVLAVGSEGGTGSFLPVSMPEAECWTDSDVTAFLAWRARLLRWGWSEVDAERLAERLVIRDRERDDRVSCAECRHYRPGRCGSHPAAGLNVSDVGRDLVAMLQWCPGFVAISPRA